MLGLDWTLVATGAVIPCVALLGLPALRRMDDTNALRHDELHSVIGVLERTDLLDGLHPALLEQLAADAQQVEVPAGSVVVRQGDPADALVVIVTGRCAVSATASAGDLTLNLPELQTGDIFGEIGLLQRTPRTATVTAVEPTTLLRVGGDAFLAAVSSVGVHPSLQEATRLRLLRTHPAMLPPTATMPDRPHSQ